MKNHIEVGSWQIQIKIANSIGRNIYVEKGKQAKEQYDIIGILLHDS